MRIAAWNANYNNRRRAFDEDAKFLDDVNADLIVLSETARPATGVGDNVKWLGEEGQPGLGVIARNGYTLSAHEPNAKAPALFGAFRVQGPQPLAQPLNLLAAWPVQKTRGAGPSYAKQLQTALDVFGEFLREKRVALIGDLNSSSRVMAQVNTHTKFVKNAAALGLTSVYHHQTGDAHGMEKLNTYRHLGPEEKEFHLDYCFLSQDLLASAKIEILNGADWKARSDHFPIIVELP